MIFLGFNSYWQLTCTNLHQQRKILTLLLLLFPRFFFPNIKKNENFPWIIFFFQCFLLTATGLLSSSRVNPFLTIFIVPFPDLEISSFISLSHISQSPVFSCQQQIAYFKSSIILYKKFYKIPTNPPVNHSKSPTLHRPHL